MGIKSSSRLVINIRNCFFSLSVAGEAKYSYVKNNNQPCSNRFMKRSGPMFPGWGSLPMAKLDPWQELTRYTTTPASWLPFTESSGDRNPLDTTSAPDKGIAELQKENQQL